MMEKNNINRKVANSTACMYASIAGIAIVCFCSLYGIKVLNPTYVDWLMAGGDLSQHYLGWMAYRASSWHFPIGMVDTLAYPYHTSIIFTDSIPIFALLFKLLSPILPADFQYFGLWGICCFILQGLCAGRIISHKSDNKIITVLASAMFLITPVMIWRMYAHTALAGQWIILYALDMVFNPDKYQSKKKNYITIAIVGLLSASIHLYFALMNGIVLAGYIIICLLREKRVKRSVFSLMTYLASVAFAVWIFGGFDSGMSAQNGGLGIYSFNLNNFVNPQGWSKILKDLPLYGNGQYEGFAYLGAGVVLLIVLAGYSCLINKSNFEVTVKNNKVKIIAIFFVWVMSVIVALSPVVSLGDKAVELKVPQIVTKMWSVFRATGRIAWVAVYVLVFLGLIGLLRSGKKVCVVLSLGLILQIYDISDVLVQKHTQFSGKVEYQTLLQTSDFWDKLAKDKEIKHVLYYSSVDQSMMYSITNWSMQNGKTVSDFYFARSISDLVNQNREEVLKELPSDTLYIFTSKDQIICPRYALHYYAVDGMIIGCANKVEGFSEIERKDFSAEWIFSNDQYLTENSGYDTEGGRTLYPSGVSYGPYWNAAAGEYIIEITGQGLLADMKIETYCDNGWKTLDYTVISRDETSIKLKVNFEENVDNLEVYIQNTSENNLLLKSITMKFAN